MSGKQVLKLLLAHGWEIDRIKGSHHVLKKANLTLVVPVHGNRDIPIGTLNSILKQAGLL